MIRRIKGKDAVENQAPRWREGLKGESPAVRIDGIAAGLLHLGPAAVVGRVHLGKIEVDNVPTVVGGDVEGNSVDIDHGKDDSFATISCEYGGLWMQSGVELLLSLTVYTLHSESAGGCAVWLAIRGRARL